MHVQVAAHNDIRELGTHHRRMFEEIWQQEGRDLSVERGREIERAYIAKLEKEIPAGACRVWVVRDERRIVASGGVTLVSFVPVPDDVNHTIAYLHSMYTEPEYRGKKMARRIVEQALSFCRALGIRRIILNASDAGKMIYEQYGFSASVKTMLLTMPEIHEEKE